MISVSLLYFVHPSRVYIPNTITPDILIHRNGDEQGPRDGLVAVNGVGGRNGRQRGDLHAEAAPPDHDNDLPRPVVVVADRGDDAADDHDGDVGDHGGEAHLGLAHAAVAAGEVRGDPVGPRAVGEEADDGADQDGEVEEADGLGRVAVRRRGKRLRLRQVDHEVHARGKGHDKGRELDDGEEVEVPRHPQLLQDAAVVRLEELELRLAGLAAPEPRVLVGDGGRQIGGIGSGRVGLLARFLGGEDAVVTLGGSGVGGSNRGVEGGRSRVSRLWKEQHVEREAREEQGRVEPPEAAPADVGRHGARDDGSHHERGKVHAKVERLVLAPVVQEDDVGDDLRLYGLAGPRGKSVEDRGAHERVVARGARPPD